MKVPWLKYLSHMHVFDQDRDSIQLVKLEKKDDDLEDIVITRNISIGDHDCMDGIGLD